MCDLKVVQINVQRNVIRKLMFNEFEVDHKATELTENICAKDEGTVEYITVTKKFQSVARTRI